MALPDLSVVCTAIQFSTQEICITFPGGAKQCVSIPQINAGDYQVAKQLIAQANAALMPYTPLFDIMDGIMALVNCLTGVIDALNPANWVGLPIPGPDIGGVLECLPGLKEKINKMLALLPPFSIPLMLLELLDVIILVFSGFESTIRRIIDMNIQAFQAALKATKTGNLKLQQVVDCKNISLDIQLTNLNSSFAPINRLFGVIDVLSKLAKILPFPAVPAFASIINVLLTSARTFRKEENMQTGKDLEFKEVLDTALFPLTDATNLFREFRKELQKVIDAIGAPPSI
ncbi:MAG: hypothetical protein A2Y38_13775 [Spirochaetes bacterium GWB1_59_5]|nr:MAG: hypothetical protein A2Y38_13775 [Spirochaetes bacterium GWB1_59_5]